MAVNLDLIDELRKRAHVSYSDAKEALEKSDGNILDALIYLEKEHKVKQEEYQHHEHPKCCKDLMSKIKNLLRKANATRVVMFKKDRVVFSLSITIAVIISVIGVHFILPATLIALITGHRFRIEGTDKNIDKVNETLNKVADAVDNVKNKLTEEDNASPNEDNK